MNNEDVERFLHAQCEHDPQLLATVLTAWRDGPATITGVHDAVTGKRRQETVVTFQTPAASYWASCDRASASYEAVRDADLFGEDFWGTLIGFGINDVRKLPYTLRARK